MADPIRTLSRMQGIGMLGVIGLLFVILSVFGWKYGTDIVPNTFLNLDNLFNGVAPEMSVYAIMAVGATVVIISGGIDISVGSIMGLSALAAAWALQGFDLHAPAWKVLPVAFTVPLAVGAFCGLINGLLVVFLRLHPFIVTLGTLSIFRCACNVLPPESTLPVGGKNLPEAFTRHLFMAGYKVSNENLRLMPMIVMLACALLGAFILKYLAFGREVYAVGGNEEAARFSGVPIGFVKLRVYAFSGLMAGVAGLVSAGRWGTASTGTGQTYELFVIAAAVVGGASLLGGRGSTWGALAGALIIKLIENGIFILKLNTAYSQGIVGIAIIVAASIDHKLGEYMQKRQSSPPS